MRKFIGFSLSVGVITLIPFFVILSSFCSSITDDRFFSYEFERHDVELNEMEPSELHHIIVQQLIGGRENGLEGILNDGEIALLADSHHFIQAAFIAWRIATLAIIFFVFLLISLIKRDRRVLRLLVAMFSVGSIVTIIIIAVSALWFFSGNTSLLNESHAILAKLYPSGLLSDLMMRILLKGFLYANFLLIVSIAIFKYSKRWIGGNEDNRR